MGFSFIMAMCESVKRERQTTKRREIVVSLDVNSSAVPTEEHFRASESFVEVDNFKRLDFVSREQFFVK